MTVVQRGNSYQAYVSHASQRLRRSFKSKAEAVAWEALTREALENDKPVPNPPKNGVGNGWTLREAFNRTFALHWEGGRSERMMLINMTKAMDFFGRQKLITDMTTSDVDDYILHMKEAGLSGATINRRLAVLSKTFRVAREYDKYFGNIVFRRQREGEHRLRWLNDDEISRVVYTAGKLGYANLQDAIVVSLDTGVRQGELGRIKALDLISEGLVVWESKNDVARTIPLTPRSRKILERRKASVKQQNSLIFKDGYARSAWDRTRTKAGLGEDVVWHTLRHTFASRLVQRGVTLQVVKELMGHKTMAVTMRYAKLAPRNLADAISMLGDKYE